jgi:predicted nicotinamide N-methyase
VLLQERDPGHVAVRAAGSGSDPRSEGDRAPMMPAAPAVALARGAEAERAVRERYRVAVRTIATGQRSVSLLQVADLEALVDRAALLSGNDACEPPYWMYLWTGAIELARRVDAEGSLEGRHALDLGCGLGLVGVVAALAGAEVTFYDREQDALLFAAANAHCNGARAVSFQRGDFTRDSAGRRFDLILGAEVLYDRDAFAPLVAFLDAHLAPGGAVLLADAHRMDTAGFYVALGGAGYEMNRSTVRTLEEGLPLRLELVRAARR